jgi:hypothetical protein
MSNRLQRKEAEQGRRISTHPSEDPDKLPPKFCLRGMRHRFSLTDCDRNEKAAFADRLYELSRSTWAALRQMPRDGQGWEIIARRAITGDRIPREISEDVNIIAFRCLGKAPMVGYRSKDGVFNIVWIDRAFTLYDHG